MKRFKDAKASLGCFVFVLFAYLVFTGLQIYWVTQINNSFNEYMYCAAVEKAKLKSENKYLHVLILIQKEQFQDVLLVQKKQFQNVLNKENEAFVNIIIQFKNQMESLIKENKEMEEFIEKYKDRHSASATPEMLRYDV